MAGSLSHGEAKVYDFSSRDKSKKRYVYVGSGDNGRIKVIFEPSEKMLDNMYNYSPSKVKKKHKNQHKIRKTHTLGGQRLIRAVYKY